MKIGKNYILIGKFYTQFQKYNKEYSLDFAWNKKAIRFGCAGMYFSERIGKSKMLYRKGRFYIDIFNYK